LTEALLAYSPRLTVVETDPRWAAVLEERFGDNDLCRVVKADAKETRLASLVPGDAPVVVFGNLPYNQAVIILMRLMEESERIDRALLMFQKEVAERIVAGPGSRDYGVLPLKLAPLTRATRLFDIRPTCFFPRPKVMSTLVRFDPLHPRALTGQALERFHRLAQGAFAARRKKVLNSLEQGDPEAVGAAREELEARGLPETTRAEQLGPEFWLAVLARLLAPGPEPAPALGRQSKPLSRDRERLGEGR
jgi:16S rRNA (adenine1518-N6/adenine1519-N6)-dimethyltransferase